VSLVAGGAECRNFHRSARALPAARRHAGPVSHRYDTAGQSLNSRLCRVPGSSTALRSMMPPSEGWPMKRRTRLLPPHTGSAAPARPRHSRGRAARVGITTRCGNPPHPVLTRRSSPSVSRTPGDILICGVARQARRIRPSPSIRDRLKSQRAGQRSQSQNQSWCRSRTDPNLGSYRSRIASRPGRTPTPSRG